jgi:hypothetical protein
VEYIEAILEEDSEEVDRIERAAELLGYGPRIECTNVTNSSAQRAFCRESDSPLLVSLSTKHRHSAFDHREPEGTLIQLEMTRIHCDVKFRVYQPLEEHRSACPYVLITVKGSHPHPIPLPLKTPTRVKAVILNLIDKMGTDLPDLTARRFLRHPLVKEYLHEKFPDSAAPVFSSLHVSLANRAHLFSYIKSGSKAKYPMGTGWKGTPNRRYIILCNTSTVNLGAQHLKELQDESFPVESRYIRRIVEIKASGVVSHDDDDETPSDKQMDLRIVVCMSPKASRRLIRAQYLQGDVAFKRVVGYREFELACLDRDANTSEI